VLLGLCVSGGGTCLGGQVVDGGATPVVLPGVRTHALRSAINGRTYHVTVALPFGYGVDGADSTRYPVLYLLDGEIELPLFASMLRLSHRGAAGNVILVGVGYAPVYTGGPPPSADGVPFRKVDYTPPRFRPPGAPLARNLGPEGSFGGAPAFLRVLREEILPLVERTYRASPDRALHGHSFGGLFATYALFEDPDLFTRYAITSPSYWWDDEAVFLREAAFKARRAGDGLPKQVFLGVGGLEGASMFGGVWQMADRLCYGRDGGAYRGLRLQVETWADEVHASSVGFSRVLRALYPPSEVDSTRVPDPCKGR
jgi:predicted alpha/beta superfamily hydrolase